ncbi:serine-rich adhesin for platelets-like isoform X3 [Argopecten irradians]|uniref:serine-rich adhesin for platelets-like isoform X3 n=1 Tax=Argopecten irradians TaxID=31199 RepID=UPI00371600B1
MTASAMETVMPSLDSVTTTMDMKASSDKGLISQSETELSASYVFSSTPSLQSSYDGVSGTQDKSLQSTMTGFVSMPLSSSKSTNLPNASLKTDIASQTLSDLPKMASQTTLSPTKYTALSSSAKISKSPILAASAMRQIQPASLPSSSDIVIPSSKSSAFSSPILKDLSSSVYLTDRLSVSNQLTSIQKRSADLSVSLTASYSPDYSKGNVAMTSPVVLTDPSATDPILKSSNIPDLSSSDISTVNPPIKGAGPSTAPITSSKTLNAGLTPTSTPKIVLPPVAPSKTVIPSGSRATPMYIPNKDPSMSTAVVPPLGPTASIPPTVPPTPATALGESLPFILGVSLCGVGIVLFFIIFAVLCCLRKKPSKVHNNKEEIRTHDLWVSTTATSDVVPSTADPLPGYESITETILSDYRKSLSNGQKECDSDDVLYKALHAYEVTQEGQLAFRKGDTITVLEKTNDGWWKGTLDDREGWFPGSFVKAIQQQKSTSEGEEKKEGEDEPDSENPKPRVSSFLLSKDQRPRSMHLPRSHSDRYSPMRQLTPKRDSWALGKEVSTPRVPQLEKKGDDSVDGISANHLRDFHLHSTAGRRYQALYPYIANFKSEISLQEGEIIKGIEKDKNGWMKGQRECTGETGWFPAVYVQELNEAVSPVTGIVEETQVYNQLLVNNSMDQEVICIEHVAVCPFAAENDQDLSFDIGDTVLVFDTLENGWWLGCHGDDVGWFPGAYVQIVTDGQSYVDEYGNTKDSQNRMNVTSPLPVSSNMSASQLSVKSDDNMSVASDISGRDRHVRQALDVGSPGTLSTFSAAKSDRSASTLSVQSRSDDDISMSSGTMDSKGSGKRIKPKRKAPKPPVDAAGGSKLPTPIKPTRQAPAPPGQNHSTPEQRGISETLALGKQEPSATKVISEFPKVEISITQDSSVEKSRKPVVPKRFVKPKLIKVPRRKLDLKKASDQRTNQVTRSPPPPRPPPPNLSFHSPSSTTNTPNITAEETTTSLENTSSFMSGFNQIEDQSGSLYRDMNITSMSANDSLMGGGCPKDDSGQLMPKLQRQNALLSEEKPFGHDTDVVNTAPVNDMEEDAVDGPLNSNSNYTVDDAKPKISRIPQFNRQNSGQTTSTPEHIVPFSPEPLYSQVQELYDSDPISNSDSYRPSTLQSFKPVTTQSPEVIYSYPSKTIPKPVEKPNSDPAEIHYSQIHVVSGHTNGIDSVPESLPNKTPESPSNESNENVPKNHVNNAENNDSVNTSSNNRDSIILEESPNVVYAPNVQSNHVNETQPNETGDGLNTSVSTEPRTKIPKVRPPVAPKPTKGIPQPKIHYKQDTSSEEVNKNSIKDINESPSVKRKDTSQKSKLPSAKEEDKATPDKRIQESPASKRKAGIQRSGIANSPAREVRSGIPVSESPTRDVKSGIPVNNSPVPGKERSGIPVNKSPKKSPRNKSNERAIPVRQNSGGNKLKTNPQNGSDQNQDTSFSPKSKPKRPNKPPDTNKKKSNGKVDSSPSRLPKLSSFQSPNQQSKDRDDKVISPPKKRSIPVAKPARPPPPNSPPASPEIKISHKGDNQQSPGSPLSSFGKVNGVNGKSADTRPIEKRSLRKTVRQYKGQNPGELSFDEGSFIMEITEDEDNPGWLIGMLADGSTGLYHYSCVEEAPNKQQTIV